MPRDCLRDRRLTAADRLVLGALVRRIDRRRWKRISLRRFAGFLHLGERTVRAAVRRLIACGYVEAEARGHGRVGRYGLTRAARGHWVGVPQAVAASDLPPLTRLAYGLVLKLSKARRRRLSLAGLARELRAGAAAIAAAFARLVAAGLLLVEGGGRGTLAAVTTAHGADWKRRGGGRGFWSINGVFRRKPSTCSKRVAPHVEKGRTQDTRGEKHLRMFGATPARGPSSPAWPPTPTAFRPNEQPLADFAARYPCPLDDSRRVGFLLEHAQGIGVDLAAILGDLDRYGAECARARRRPEHVQPASEFVARVLAFHVERP